MSSFFFNPSPSSGNFSTFQPPQQTRTQEEGSVFFSANKPTYSNATTTTTVTNPNPQKQSFPKASWKQGKKFQPNTSPFIKNNQQNYNQPTFPTTATTSPDSVEYYSPTSSKPFVKHKPKTLFGKEPQYNQETYQEEQQIQTQQTFQQPSFYGRKQAKPFPNKNATIPQYPNTEETPELETPHPPYKSTFKKFPQKQFNKKFSPMQEESPEYKPKNLTWNKQTEETPVDIEPKPKFQSQFQRRNQFDESASIPVKASKPFFKKSQSFEESKYSKPFRKTSPSLESQDSQFAKPFPKKAWMAKEAEELPVPTKYSKPFVRRAPVEDSEEVPTIKPKPVKKAQVPLTKYSKFPTKKTQGYSSMKSQDSASEEPVPPTKRISLKKPPVKKALPKVIKRAAVDDELNQKNEETPESKSRDAKFPVKRASIFKRPSALTKKPLLSKKPIVKKEPEDEVQEDSTSKAQSVLTKPKLQVPMKKANIKSIVPKKAAPKPIAKRIVKAPKQELESVPASAQPTISLISVGDEDDINAASFIKGTCLDMCPEKERNDRQEFQDLSVFEMEPDSINTKYPIVNHQLAVKKFARPSVNLDGAASIRSDMIRPPNILRKTMDYLIDQILDRTDYPFYEVHNFIRDRTRSIRQDFTYQGIQDERVVEIIEQIARFHILSQHKLCEESRENYESQMNMEQLNKCLISLRLFYDDLRQKGILCPNEPEFRAYFVLTHLEQDVLQYCSQMTSKVLSSPEILFVLQIWRTIKENNYALFFKLVRSATYLVACLMHEYFIPVRFRAIGIMKKAYRDPFPLVDFTDTLGFEDEQDAANFCVYHGLMINDQANIEFKTSTIIKPTLPFPQKISRRLVEPKAVDIALADIVHGETEKIPSGTFPPEPLPPPVYADSEEEENVEPIAEPEEINKINAIPVENIEEITETPIEDEIETPMEEPEELEERDLEEEPEQEEVEEEIENQEEEEEPEEPSVEELPPSIKVMSPKTSPANAPPSPRIFRTNTPPMSIARMPSPPKADIFVPETPIVYQPAPMDYSKKPPTPKMIFTQPDFVPEVARTVSPRASPRIGIVESPKIKKPDFSALLAEAKNRERIYIYRKYLRIWMEFVAMRKQQREEEERTAKKFKELQQRSVDWFQNSLKSTSDKLEELIGRKETLTRQLSSPIDSISNQISRREYLEFKSQRIQQRQQDLSLPIDIVKAVSKFLFERNGGTPQLYFKACIFSQSPVVDETAEWLAAKLSLNPIESEDENVDILSLFSTSDLKIPFQASRHLRESPNLGLCVNNIYLDNFDSDTISKYAYGSQGIIYLLPPFAGDENYWNEHRSNLNTILSSDSITNYTPILILFHALDANHILDEQENIKEQLQLDEYFENWNITPLIFEDYRVATYSVTSGLEWLASNSEPQPKIESENLREFVEENIFRYSKPLFDEYYTIRNTDPLPTQLSEFVRAFNESLQLIIQEVSSSELMNIKFPPKEFGNEVIPSDWNDEAVIEANQNQLDMILLPYFNFNEKDASSFILQYFMSLPVKDNNFRLYVASNIEYLLQNNTNKTLPWHKIFEHIYNYQISLLPSKTVFFVAQRRNAVFSVKITRNQTPNYSKTISKKQETNLLQEKRKLVEPEEEETDSENPPPKVQRIEPEVFYETTPLDGLLSHLTKKERMEVEQFEENLNFLKNNETILDLNISNFKEPSTPSSTKKIQKGSSALDELLEKIQIEKMEHAKFEQMLDM